MPYSKFEKFFCIRLSILCIRDEDTLNIKICQDMGPIRHVIATSELGARYGVSVVSDWLRNRMELHFIHSNTFS